MDVPTSASIRQDLNHNVKSNSNMPVRVKAVINIFSALLAFPAIAKDPIFDQLKNNPKLEFLFIISRFIQTDA